MKRLRSIAALAVVAAACAGATPAAVAPTTTTLTTAPATTTSTTTPLPTTSLGTTTTTSPTTATTAAGSPTTSSTTTTTLAPLTGFRIELVTDEVHRPLTIAMATGDDRLFIAQQEGVILVYDAVAGLLAEPFLDIDDIVAAIGIEQGLLGLAFHPDYAANGRFFVYYNDETDDTHLVEYAVSADPNRADPNSAKVLMSFSQPTNRHNAGMIQFGPQGYLYLSLGDGGMAFDHGQNTESVLGSIIRIDVDGGDPYAIPADNPFPDSAAPELWTYGLRNPWRFSIDPVGGHVYIADVGQEKWEEVSVIPIDSSGLNLGWPIMEGSHCFSERDCADYDLVWPAVDYPHDEGCSVSGGFVYRGSLIPELYGHYFYGDWCNGWLRSFTWDGTAATDQRDWFQHIGSVGQVTTLAPDADGELLIATWGGEIYRLVAER